MANPFFQKFGNRGNVVRNNPMSLLNQVQQLQSDPGKILDILKQNGKINQQQYNELQSCRNNPQQIFQYLSNSGNADQLNQAKQWLSQISGNV